MPAVERRVRMAGIVIHFLVEGEFDAVDMGSSPDEGLRLLCVGCLPTSDPPDITCTVRVESFDAPDAPVDFSFFHGGMRVRRTRAGWALRDLRCWVDVDLGARTIQAHIAPGRHYLVGFFRTTVFVAVVLQLRQFLRFHLHAGLVQQDEHRLLIVGPSGAGKSTTTLSLRRAGFEALADDAVFLGPDAAYPIARPFHFTQKTQGAFPEIVPDGGTELGKLEAQVAAPSGPARPSGIVFLSGPTTQTQIARLDAAEALGLLVESSALVVVNGATQVDEHMAVLSDLVSRVPSVLLAAGPEWLDEAPTARLLAALTQ